MWTYAFLFSSLMVDGDTLLPHSAFVMSSTRRTDTPARYISMRASHAAFTAAIPFDNSSFKGDPLELGPLEGDVSGSGGEITVVVPAAVALALLAALVPGRLGQLLCLGLQKLVEGFLYAASHQLFDLPLDYF